MSDFRDIFFFTTSTGTYAKIAEIDKLRIETLNEIQRLTKM